MKKDKIIGNFLLILSIISIPISFSLCCIIGEADIFSIGGIVRYSWIMWLFIPICILCILFGRHLKNKNLPYKKNYIIAIICLSLLLIFGSYRFIFRDASSYDANRMIAIEEKTNLDLPEKVKIATTKGNQSNLSYVKILSEDEKICFENEIKNNPLWKNDLGDFLYSALPMNIQLEAQSFNYFIIYDISTQKYNPFSLSDNGEFIFIAYDCEIGRLIILDNSKS